MPQITQCPGFRGDHLHGRAVASYKGWALDQIARRVAADGEFGKQIRVAPALRACCEKSMILVALPEKSRRWG